MKLVELRRSMFSDEDAFLAAQDFHYERAMNDSEIVVRVFKDTSGVNGSKEPSSKGDGRG